MVGKLVGAALLGGAWGWTMFWVGYLVGLRKQQRGQR